MSNVERYRFQDFAWLDRSFDETIDFLREERGREIGLYLPNRGVDPARLDALLNLAESNGFLAALMLDRNKIGDEGCKRLAQFLKEDTKLTYIFLENNNISDDGVRMLIEALRQNTGNHVKSLWLGRNDRITDHGIEMFSEYMVDQNRLFTNQSLRNSKIKSERESVPSAIIKEFSIGGCNTANDAAFCLARAINACDHLTSVHLLDNRIGYEGARLLAEIASRQAGLKTMEIHAPDTDMPSEKFTAMLGSMAEKEQEAAFREALANGEEGPWMRCKLMVVGQGRAGKTATVHSMLNKPFNDALASTIGAEISLSNTARRDGTMWDGNNQGKDKVELAVDAANRLAALKLQKKKRAQDSALASQSIEELRAALKTLQDQEQAELAARALMKNTLNLLPKEASDEINKKFKSELVMNKNAELEDIAFTIWDYGGQKVFYTLHHLFLTKYGIYILCFDMRDIICPEEKERDAAARQRILAKQTEAKEYLEFWLNSVKMHASDAPMLLIGTFLDTEGLSSDQSLLAVNAFLRHILVSSDGTNKFPQVVQNNSLFFFPLSNRKKDMPVSRLSRQRVKSNIDAIRDTIEEIARTQDFVNQNLSLRWIKCLDMVLDQPGDVLRLARVEELAKACGINSMNEVEEMLLFFHELGMIVWINSTQNLRDIVTTKPQWLIDALSKVIRDKDLHSLKFSEPELKRLGLVQMYKLARERSIVTRDWLEYLWTKKDTLFLIDLMRRTMLISDWTFGEFERDPAFLVPSLTDTDDLDAADIAKAYLVQFGEPQVLEMEKLQEMIKKRFRNALGLGMDLNLRRKNAQNQRINNKALEVNIDEDNIDYQNENDMIEQATALEEKETEKMNQVKEIDDISVKKEDIAVPKGFYSRSEASCMVFDFGKSYLPHGVFQRLVCLLILKCTSDRDKQAKIEPELFRNYAKVFMEGSNDGQVIELFQRNKQVLCRVRKDFLGSYKIIVSMLNKLKGDVMGEGLEWDALFEVVDNSDQTAEGFFHTFIPFEEARDGKISPWFHEKIISDEDRTVQKGGIELEDFLADLSAF